MRENPCARAVDQERAENITFGGQQKFKKIQKSFKNVQKSFEHSALRQLRTRPTMPVKSTI